jgi:hypothetical protein
VPLAAPHELGRDIGRDPFVELDRREWSDLTFNPDD